MKKINFKILKKNIPNVKLHIGVDSTIGRYWYNYEGKLVSWYNDKGELIDENIEPPVGYVIKNVNQKEGLVFGGLYRWNGSLWEQTESENFHIPLLLTENINTLGIMSEFDGDIEQIEEKTNFTYTGQNNIITVFNTVNIIKHPFIEDSEFIINWGDGSSEVIDINSSLSHTYSINGEYVLTLTKISEWGNETTKKTINVPYVNITTSIENFNEYLDYTNYTNGAEITGETTSRIDELKKYGTNNDYDNLTFTPEYTGYSFTYSNSYGDTIDINYRDYNNGKTFVFIPEDRDFFVKNEEYNGKITRTEHLIGFVEEPRIYSDVFVERGKLGVMERIFRLSEIQSIDELEIYGNGFFNVRKQ